MDWLLEKIIRYPRQSGIVSLVIVLICVALAWWLFVWQSPQYAFENMLANNLTTTSVTKRALAGTTSQGIEQVARLQMGSTNAADWLVTARQSGSVVATESIGTPTTGYIRYLKISTLQRSTSGKSFDFSSVLNKWGKADGKTDTTLNDLFSQTLLDISSAPVPPIGNLPTTERENILAYNRDEKVFTPDYSKVKRETVNGRNVYTYQVAVKLGAYVRMMQAFAHDLGLTSLDTIDPSQYSTVPPITISISIDQASHQLARVAYANSGFSQDYSSWGLLTPIATPKAVLTTTELQDRITALSTAK